MEPTISSDAEGDALPLEQLQNAHGHALEMRQRLLGGDKRDQLGHILFEERITLSSCQAIKAGVDRIGGALTLLPADWRSARSASPTMSISKCMPTCRNSSSLLS